MPLSTEHYANRPHCSIRKGHWPTLCALFNLAIMYKDGQGAPHDKARMYAYFKLAKLITEGSINPEAQESLDQLQKTMTPSEIEAKDRILGSWKPQPSALTKKAAAGFAEAERFLATRR